MGGKTGFSGCFEEKCYLCLKLIILNRHVPSRFLDSYLSSSSNGLIVPVAIEKNA